MIISTVERKSFKGRLALFVIYSALFLGSITMLYPFLLMLRLSTADSTDRETLSPLPEFWWDMNKLALKYADHQYYVSDQVLAQAYGSESWTSLSQAPDIQREQLQALMALPSVQLKKRYQDFVDFKAVADPRFLHIQDTYIPGVDWKDFWIQYYLSARDKVSPLVYNHIEPQKPDWRRRDWTPTYDRDWLNWQEWLGQLRAEQRYIFSTEGSWQIFLKNRYKGDLEALNKAHAVTYHSFWIGPVFPLTAPQSGGALKEDWEIFVREALPLFWQKLTPAGVMKLTPAWREFLISSKLVKTPEDWALFTGLPAHEPKTITLPEQMPPSEVAARWWCEFVAEKAGVEDRVLLSSENDFREFMRRRYGSLAALNTAWGSDFQSWEQLRLPVADADAFVLKTRRAGIVWNRTFHNYGRVMEIMAGVGGGPFLNTAIIILLSIITSLTVNPVAAYALSRFRLRRTQKALVFLLGTMALPGEVALVPGFLLVRDLGLTDNYLALVLPGAANAFSIFLLKGFFDSLPQELYEAATLDGAGEARMFFQITIPLSMPIIAVTMLGTITASYNLFMPAVMYLGDTGMWPVATKIYEINQTQGLGIGMAALVVASIFPLLVFTFCQRIIMRGIILPSMK